VQNKTIRRHVLKMQQNYVS